MSRTRPPLVAAAIALSSIACSDSTTPGQADFTITPATAWAGSEIVVAGHGLATASTPPVFRVGDSTLAGRSVNDSTWAVTLPTTVSGPVTVTLTLNGHGVTLDPVKVRGATRADEFTVRFPWDLLVWPKTGDASVLGGDADGNLVLLNATTGVVTTIDSLIDSNLMRGPGVTTRDSTFLLRPRLSQSLESWTLFPAPARIEQFAAITSTRQVMQFGPDAFFVSHNHQFDVTAPGGNYSEQAEETSGVIMSPTHDRATIRVNSDPSGAPVFNVATGAIAYRLADLTSVQGAEFSADGQLLAAAGGVTGPGTPGRVVLVQAANGTVLQDTTLTSAVWGIALDPNRPLVYVGIDVPDAGGGGATHPGIVVLDRGSLARLGLMVATASGPGCIISGCYGGVLATSSEPAVYAIWSWQGNARAWRFGTGD